MFIIGNVATNVSICTSVNNKLANRVVSTDDLLLYVPEFVEFIVEANGWDDTMVNFI